MLLNSKVSRNWNKNGKRKKFEVSLIVVKLLPWVNTFPILKMHFVQNNKNEGEVECRMLIF